MRRALVAVSTFVFSLFVAWSAGSDALRQANVALDAGGPRTWYVDPANGIDTNDGTAFDSAVKTIDKAGLLANPGDTVYLRGTASYPPSTFTALHWSGLPGQAITVQSWPGDARHPAETAIFDPGIEYWTLSPPPYPEFPWTPCEDGDECGPDEYVSTTEYPVGKYYGTMLASNTRLLTYGLLEDLRATNESAAIVPLSDPRPAGGPLMINNVVTSSQIPWTYRGPGLWYNPSTHRIHIRLSHTHLGIAGVTDYAGETNPNTVMLSITHHTTIPAVNRASHIVFRDIVFQNGGFTVMESGGPGVEDVTFDHCTFQGARYGFRLGTSKNVRFLHSTFSAMLGSWVSRDDVKGSYDFLADEGKTTNNKGSWTADMLLTTIPSVEDLEIANCEFRDGHDAVQVWGKRARVHHNLFENINDEVFYVDGYNVEDLRIYNNVIRKSLDVFSHAFGPAVGSTGARYYFRNIIDNRVPTLGYHRQPADGQAIWRAGSDFKMNQPIGEFYAFHNTFIQAFPHLELLSQVFTDTTNQPQPRKFLNNIHMTFDGHDPLHELPTASFPGLSDGNVWHRRTTVVTAPLYRGNIASAPSGWDTHSIFSYPKFLNVPDYGVPHNAPFENTDYRLETSPASPACGAGVNLSTETWGGQSLPAIDPLTADLTPDIGALPCGANPVTVGVDSATAFPASGVFPIARAGDYSVISDSNRDGFENAALNASTSANATTYTWRYGYNGPVVASTATATLPLPVGTHKLFLTADGAAGFATDMREVTVTEPTSYTNLLKNVGFEDGDAHWNFTAGGAVVSSPTHFGTGALHLEGAVAARQVDQVVPIIPNSTVSITGWFKTSALPARKAARFQVEWLDASNVSLGSSTFATASLTTPWSYQAGTYSATIPATAVRVKVKLALDAGSTGGNAYFDDLRVRITDNKVLNAHFEHGTTSWNPLNFPQPLTLTTDPAEVRSGSAALAITGATTYRRVEQRHPISAGQTRTFSGWIKTAGLLGTASLRVRFWNQPIGGSPFGDVTIGDPKTGNSSYSMVVSGSIEAPANARALTMEIHLPGIAGETGTAWFDDIYMK